MSTMNNNSQSSDKLEHAGIKGMKWGVRRFQNPDGTLTELGRKRYAKMEQAKLESNKVATNNKSTGLISKADADKYADANANVGQMVKDDLDNTNKVLRETGNSSRLISSKIRSLNTNVKRMDLCSMTDKEMRDRINREQLERQYDQMFNNKRSNVERGKTTVANIVDGLGTTTTLVASGLAIALAIKELKS